jgi:hypothetical protein
MKLRKMPVILVGFMTLSLGMVYILDSVLGAAPATTANKPAQRSLPSSSSSSLSSPQEDDEQQSGKEEAEEVEDQEQEKQEQEEEETEEEEEVATEDPDLDLDLDLDPGRPDKVGRRMDAYRKMYEKKRAAKRRKEEEKIIDEINSNAYLGDDSYSAKRLYLLEQAYKRAREAVPVLPLTNNSIEENELLVRAHQEHEDEDDIDALVESYRQTVAVE